MRKHCNGDLEQVRQMIQAYLDDLDPRVDSVASSIAEAAPVQVQAAAEELREATELLGGIRLARACAAIGVAAAAGDLTNATTVLPGLRAAQVDVRSWLAHLLHEPTPAVQVG
ncbi:MAG TPA: hypothetical protein VFO77_00470 [Actinoplanes sp.]|nr:hypothetical protein [Actinoplanes sp.]